MEYKRRDVYIAITTYDVIMSRVLSVKKRFGQVPVGS